MTKIRDDEKTSPFALHEDQSHPKGEGEGEPLTNRGVEFLKEHEDFQIMKKVYHPEAIKLPKGVWNQAFNFLKNLLYITYGSCQFGLLVAAVEKNPLEEARKISQNFHKIAVSNGWSEKTTLSVISNIKKIMKQTTLSIHFINKLTTIKERGIDRKSIEYCLPGKYKKYDSDHPEKELLLGWLELCKTETRNKSQSSLKQIVQFAAKICHALRVDLSAFDQEYASNIPLQEFKNAIDQIDLKIPLKTKVRFTCIIIKNFFKSKVITQSELVEWRKSLPKENNANEQKLHYISEQEFELLFEAATKSSNRDIAIFLLVVTTNLRVSDISNLLVKNLTAETNTAEGKGNDQVTVLDEGHTQNGKKCFVICERLKSALNKWMIEDRNILSEYLFPGIKQGPLSSSRISKIMKEIASRANISGDHVHAYSVRRSFTRLLENENNLELVNKILGHASEKFYPKETAAQASKRYNIPWLSRSTVN